MVRVKAYSQLVKPRLSMLVVFSALFGFLMAPGITGFDPVMLSFLALGGFLVTGASNTLNQVIETEYDALMVRTKDRPMVRGVISHIEAIIFALITAIGGILILGLVFDGLVAALLGIIALLSYAFVYTPLKRVTSIGVIIGAIPGAMPPLIGWAAATGSLDTGAWILFGIQFLWQFPHFWAIAWVLDDDYKSAGYKMLPNNAGRSYYSAAITLIYTSLLIPVSIVPYFWGISGTATLVTMIVAGIGFTWQAFVLMRKMTLKSASRLMFGSFLYLPLVQIVMLIDKF